MTYSRAQLLQWQWADTQRYMAAIIRLVTDPDHARRQLAAAEQVRAALGGSKQTPPDPDKGR